MKHRELQQSLKSFYTLFTQISKKGHLPNSPLADGHDIENVCEILLLFFTFFFKLPLEQIITRFETDLESVKKLISEEESRKRKNRQTTGLSLAPSSVLDAYDLICLYNVTCIGEHIRREFYSSYMALFEWADGPLVQSMKQGDMFLVDEISLAGKFSDKI